MSRLEPTTPPEEVARVNPNTITALWRIIQIGEDSDRFEQGSIRLESADLDETGIEVVADEMRERYNMHGSLRAEIASQQERIRELEANLEQLRDALHRIESAANEQKAEADPDPDEIWLMARKALKGGDAHE